MEPTSDRSKKEIEVIAHRGGRGFGIDNTLPAMEAAVRAGVRNIETDLRWTADSKLIICHDAIVSNHIVSRTKYDELKKHVPERPLAVEVLESLAGWVTFDLEVKQAPVRVVRDMLHDYNIELACLITSFDPEFLEEFKRTCPEVRCGLLFRAPFSFHRKSQLAASIGVEVLLPYLHNIEEEFVASAHGEGLDVYAWTVNEVPELEKLVAWGIDGVVTDKYLDCRKALESTPSNHPDGGNASARPSPQ